MGVDSWAVSGGEEESLKGLESRGCQVFKETETLTTAGLPGTSFLH